MQENVGSELASQVLQVRSDEMIILIALKYANDQDGDKLREFWSKYMDVLPMTGLMGMNEGKYGMERKARQ